jgi:hypothetical protein
MLPREHTDYLHISHVCHKYLLNVNYKYTNILNQCNQLKQYGYF